MDKIFSSKTDNNQIKKKIQEKDKEFVSLIKYEDKIIGCNRDKIKSVQDDIDNLKKRREERKAKENRKMNFHQNFVFHKKCQIIFKLT